MKIDSKTKVGDHPSLKKLLTIIIPTKNRPYLLDRSLSYYAEINFLARIVVIDSSDSILSKKTKKTCNKYDKNLTIDYTHVGVNTEVSDKHYIAADMVDTPYILSVGDDDFPLESAINKILLKLEKDSSIVAAFGERMAITQIDSKTSGFKWVGAYPNYSGISITNNNALDRIRRIPIPMWQQYPNSIFRTEPYREAYKMVRNLEHTQYAEFFTLSFILAHGKWVKYNILFAVCHQESESCHFKDRNLFPSYIGSGGSVLNGVSQKSWSKNVSQLCYRTAHEFLNDSDDSVENVAHKIRDTYYSKLIYFLEYNNRLSDNLFDSNSSVLRVIHNIYRKISKLYWIAVLHDKPGGVYEYVKFLYGVAKEITSGRLIRMVFSSNTNNNLRALLISIKRSGSLDFESDNLLLNSSKFCKEYRIIFKIWTNDPCPQSCPKQLKNNLHD
jgi:glycosyltransferase domain-containing protein